MVLEMVPLPCFYRATVVYRGFTHTDPFEIKEKGGRKEGCCWRYRCTICQAEVSIPTLAGLGLRLLCSCLEDSTRTAAGTLHAK